MAAQAQPSRAQAGHAQPGQAPALRGRARAREFALGLPEAYEDFPWGESVAKVNGKVFVFLGSDDPERRIGIMLKLPTPEVHEHALSVPGARPAGYGLARTGWVHLALDVGRPPASELLTDWVEESYRAVAPKRLVAALDALRVR